MNIFDFASGSLEAQLWQILFLSIRCGAALLAAPMIGGTAVPVPLRVLLSISLGLLVSTWLPLPPIPEMLSFIAILAVVQEVVIGTAMGFLLQLAFAAPLIAAEQISGTMGLAIATSIDPSSGAQSGALGTFFSLMLTLLFYAIGGHLLWFELLIESYRLLPAGGSALSAVNAQNVVLFMGHALAAAAAIALPVVLVLLLVQVVTGIVARSAPALNLFALGLPAGVLAGIIALIVVMPIMIDQLALLIESGLEEATRLVGTMRVRP
ncbi:flagellar biosynthetic protein FliR [Erythrobacter sp.]|jgi:flagellar biosynthetic protein FliR|uniref:flagellar biosynthetic protein FliR n=1 Tax=Erythrobacter sp. TaxID=1042 RepID=UPI002E9E9297|nr:flagellar biosynthetic protein FliR [Erythrobacter sp.]